MRFRLREVLEREFKLSPPAGRRWCPSDVVRLLAASGLDLVEDYHSLQERDYWDSMKAPLARRNMTCLLDQIGSTAQIELKMPMPEESFLYREFVVAGEGQTSVFRDPLIWHAPGLAQVKYALQDEISIGQFTKDLRSMLSSRTRRIYWWITDDKSCSRNDFFAHDSVLVFDEVQGFIDGRALEPYIEIELEVCAWAHKLPEIVDRTISSLLAEGFNHAPVSKYRRIALLGGQCE